MERIYRLYGQGYGTQTMLEKCETAYYKFRLKYYG